MKETKNYGLFVITPKIKQGSKISVGVKPPKKKKGKNKRLTVEITEKSDTSIIYYKLKESNIYSPAYLLSNDGP